MSSKKQPVIKDLAAFTYTMFKIHDDCCHSVCAFMQHNQL